MIAHTSVQPYCVIIEDQALIAMSLEAYFEDVGFAVHTLTSIAQAQAWLKDNTPELAILDFMLRDGPATQLAASFIVAAFRSSSTRDTPGILGCHPNCKRCRGLKSPPAVKTC
jgi:ActR/RegA family two-component response regulator